MSQKTPAQILISKIGIIGAIIAAVITALGVIIGAYFGFLGVMEQVNRPIWATQTAEAKIELTASTSYTLLPSPTPNDLTPSLIGGFPTPLPTSISYFNIYTDADATDNHFYPTGKMGDIDDIEEINETSSDNPHIGTSVIKIVYNARGQGTHLCPEGVKSETVCKWAGLYWQRPPNNWGWVSPDKAGFNLTGFRKLTFCARADPDSSGVKIKFQVGGIGWTATTPLPFPDSQLSPQASGWLSLTSQWQCFEIPLSDADLSYVIGGFAWIVNWDNNGITEDNPKRIVFYLDDIRFER